MREARPEFERDRWEGIARALIAAYELLDNLDPEDTEGHRVIFNTMIGGLADLKNGRTPPEFLQKIKRQGRPSDPVELWFVRAHAAAVVHELIEGKILGKEEAERRVADLLERHRFRRPEGKPIRRSTVCDWRTRLSEKDDTIPAGAVRHYHDMIKAGILRVPEGTPADEAEATLLDWLRIESLIRRGYPP